MEISNPQKYISPEYLIALREDPRTCELFYGTLKECVNEVESTNVPFMGKAVLNAYLNGDKDELFTAITGWSVKSIVRMMEDKAKASFESEDEETEF